MIPEDDRGLTLGVGLFETLLVVDGAPRFWRAHVERLRRGCGALDLPAPAPEALAEAARRSVEAAGVGEGRAAVRLSWTGGSGARGLAAPQAAAPRLFAQAVRAPEPPASVALATATVRRNPTSPASRLKTLSYLDNVEARREATCAGADEALCLDMQGRIACAAAANVFWLEGDRLCTPSTACGVLEGVIRGHLLAAAPRLGLAPRLVEAQPDRLRCSGGVFVTNSLIGCVPVRSLDASPLPPPDPALSVALARIADAPGG